MLMENKKRYLVCQLNFYHYLLNQPGPTFPESLFVSLRFEDAGNGIINSFLLPFTPDDITVTAIVPHHLLTSVRYVRTHGCEPFHIRENLDGIPVFRRIDYLFLLIQILHPFLGERRLDDIAHQIFHGRFVIGRYAVAAKYVESGMPPC